MRPVHTQHFSVRHSECDAHGRVHTSHVLRYMQEAAFGASDAVGWGFRRYTAEGLVWLAYETTVNIARPLGYAERLTVRTWVENWRRVRSLRRYDLFVGDEPVGDGATDWVLLDAATLMPTAIPPAIVAAYSGDEEAAEAPRTRAVLFPPVADDAYSERRTVEWREIDSAGHVNNAVYIDWIEGAARAALGTTALIARRHQVEYKAAALLGDVLRVQTWQGDADTRWTSITREADGKRIAQAESVFTSAAR